MGPPFLPLITCPCPHVGMACDLLHTQGQVAWMGRPSSSVLFGCMSSGGPLDLSALVSLFVTGL